MNKRKSPRIGRDTKRMFFKKGTCSRTFFYLLNREFGHPLDNEEQAADPLAGGIIQQGYQCGMLWGASLAVGAEAFRRAGDIDKAIGMAVKASGHVIESFVKRTNTPDCGDITETDWTKKWSILKYMIRGKMITCFSLAGKWAPEAYGAAEQGLSLDPADLPKKPVSCASEVVRKMGGSEEEMTIVAGLAGGIGLSGNACGALGAAIWMNTLGRVRANNYKYSLNDPVLEQILKAFYEASDYEMECMEITGKRFDTVKDHTEFINDGGCKKLIEVLADVAAREKTIQEQ
jgi:hypothetical protein